MPALVYSLINSFWLKLGKREQPLSRDKGGTGLAAQASSSIQAKKTTDRGHMEPQIVTWEFQTPAEAAKHTHQASMMYWM